MSSFLSKVTCAGQALTTMAFRKRASFSSPWADSLPLAPATPVHKGGKIAPTTSVLSADP
eukprot:6943213-Prorocentrum_lima.AAC.1